MSQEFLTYSEAADRLGVSVEAVKKRVQRGRLKAVSTPEGRRILWPPPGEAGDNAGDKGQDKDAQDRDRTRAVPPDIALLEARIEHLEETITRLEADKATLAAALDKAQSALLNQQSLSLPAAVKEMKAIPAETKQRRPWWRIW